MQPDKADKAVISLDESNHFCINHTDSANYIISDTQFSLLFTCLHGYWASLLQIS